MLETGRILAGYRVGRMIGRGGMGAVFEATQLSLDRIVALKVISQEYGDDPVFRERFRREGVMQAALDHPHIVPIHEAGEADGHLYLAMRLIRGGNLLTLLAGGAADPRRTLNILAQAAEALDAAHASGPAGLVHRDVKPQNILVDSGDYAYLADFGLAKAPGEQRLTRTGQRLGTLDYIAPEQIRGEEPGASADIYALGAVLYECLTGAVPFPRDTDAAVLYAHLADAVPAVRERNAQLPEAIDAVLQRAMAKDPADRYRTASALIEDAQHAVGEGSVRPVEVITVRPRAGETVIDPAPVKAVPDVETRPRRRGLPLRREAGAQPASPFEPAAVDERADVFELAPAIEIAAPEAPEADLSERTTASAEPLPEAGDTVEVDVPAVEAAGVSPRRSARGKTLTRHVVGVVVVAAAIAAGVVAGRPGSRSASPATAQHILHGVGVVAPSAWKPAHPGLLALDGLGFASLRDGEGELDIAVPHAAAPIYLPYAMREHVSGTLPRAQAVRTTNFSGYRYPAVSFESSDTSSDVYALPTDAGVIVAVCTGSAECAKIVGTITFSGQPTGLEPNAQFAAALNGSLAKLSVSVPPLLAELSYASTRTQQAETASAVAAAFRREANRLAGVALDPVERSWMGGISAALSNASAAYRELSRAAVSASADDYRVAAQRVKAAETRARSTVARLAAFGYSLGG